MNKREWKKFVNLIENPRQLATEEDLRNARFKHPLDTFQMGVKSISLLVPYAFKCSWCSDIGTVTPKGLYQVHADTLGGNIFNKRTTMDDVIGGPIDEIFSIREIKFTPDYSSSINQVKGAGYLCDHCFECHQDSV